MKRTLVIIGVLGYLQAALYYWRWGGFPREIALICPLCPHIDGIGSDWQKFSERTLAFGTINTVLWLALFLIGFSIFKIFGQRGMSDPNESF
jgi:hypothetical protein